MNNELQLSPLTFSIFAPAKIDIFLNGDFKKEILPELEKDIAEIHALFEQESHQNGTLTVLVDMNNFSGEYDIECFNAMAAFMNANRHLVTRSAVFGNTGKSDLATEIVTLFTGRDNVKTFNTRQEAVEWLESIQ